MPKRAIILESTYPNREKMKKALEDRGIKVLTIPEAVDYYSNKIKNDKPMSKGIRIKGAIEYFNLTKDDDEPRLTQDSLAEIVLPDLQPKTASQYLSGWNHGNKLGPLKPEHIHDICEVTGVDANFLFGTKAMEKK